MEIGTAMNKQHTLETTNVQNAPGCIRGHFNEGGGVQKSSTAGKQFIKDQLC
jgi:hypothetical protein